ncbi:hypothetical protein BDV25DRAFT_170018 [Aspergillus avenaceus]|uniref:AMP-dependent synthetase/ligase domain-containing protein n=1 Tax=Aspergillus avenaceus TaxID=36643 RepID=A0A5N6U2D0_ASPAV|nr:hypothetical protein BDV25DRAFT_170018 [Aspergillus avenaceus]
MAPIIEQLPNEPFFHHLLRGVEANYFNLLTDVLYMRQRIRHAVPASMFDSHGRIDSKRPYMIVLAPGNYDYLVAALAILACGGAFAPIASSLTPEEICHLASITNASCILVSPHYQDLESQIQEYYAGNAKFGEPAATIQVTTNNPPMTPSPHIQIDPAMTLDPKSPGLLIFTSGTTGPPKGVVRPRCVWYANLPEVPSDHVVTAGARIEVIEDTPGAIWESFAKGQVTLFTAPPITFAALMRYFQENLDRLPGEQRNRYIEGARVLRRVVVSGGVTWPKVMEFWNQLLGHPLRNMYSSTEVTAATETTDGSDPALERCIGKPCRGVEVKLSEGDHGEILLKSDTMFTHYLGEEAATRAVFDEEGYYKSGDFGHLVGDQYVIDGRSSTDFIRFHGLRVPIHEVEARLLELPYISEAYVVPTTLNYQRQIAVLVRPTITKSPVRLLQIRSDLQDKIQRYKLPTLMRILRDDEQIPSTISGKPMRKKIEEQYFSLPEDDPLPADVQLCNPCVGMAETSRKAWDWAGMM